jgi:hypothetical protein
MAILLKEIGDFKLYTKGVPYKSISGLIRNKKTGEIFEGCVTLYRYKQYKKEEWLYDEDIYESALTNATERLVDNENATN